MGKPLSRPGCLRQSPCCSKKGEDGDAFNEDGYIPQRSIYDTMCINEHIDHGSAHSTLGSRGAQNAAFPSNGSLEPIQLDIFDKRSPQVSSFGRRLDERVIFDSLKLAHDEQTRSPGGYARTVSPSVSCSSAPCGSGSMNKRYHHQDTGKKENLCRHSWKVVTPPKYPECIELSPGEKHLLNPGMAFFPGSLSSPRSPQISPFSGSPLSAGAHTPPVFFSPGKPLLFHQEQFHRQSLPAKFQPHPLTSPLSELSVSALQYDHPFSHCMDSLTMEQMDRRMLVSITQSIEDDVFGEVETKTIDSKVGPYPPTPEPENDTAPLLQPPVSQPPARSPVMMESTWPRRLIGRRRTVRQGGAVHNLPILPPLPSVLRRCVTDKKTLPRLSPFPEHQAKVDVALLGKSPLKGELLKDCSLQDWKILKEIEERKGVPPNSSQQEVSPEVIQEEEVQEEELSEMPTVVERDEPAPKESQVTAAGNTDEENWDAVLEMVNNMWDEAWEDQETQLTGSLRQCWPLLQPPTGFGGSQAPSCSNSLVGVEDLLDMEMMNKDELKDSKEAKLQALLQHSLSTESQQLEKIEKKAVRGIIHVVDKQPEQTATSICLDLITVEAQVLMAEEHVNSSLKMSTVNEESPDSNHTLESDSGVYLTNRSHTSQDDFTVDVDRTLTDIDMGSTSSLNQVEEIAGDQSCRKEESTAKTYRNKVVIQSSVVGDLLSDPKESNRGSFKNPQHRPQFKNPESWKSENKTTVIRAGTDSPLPLSPSKHMARASTKLLDCGDMDPFVATDSFVYLAVSAKPQELSTTVKAVQKEALLSVTSTRPCLNPDECDFLSTDSFVYLAAPDCHLMGTEGHSMCSGSKDSDSDEDSGSRVDCAAGSAVEDSDWDSDLSDSEPEGSSSAKPGWDLWDELEQEVLPGLFDGDEQEQELEKLCGVALQQQQQQQRQIGWQAGLASEASVADGDGQKVLAVSESTEGEEIHTESFCALQ
ncbi:uncharacterized protein LOC121693167 [Alosa sapidissima]|uniref:uncharacterized protein LOC121693167 n=1 Tax=Alosa sapidissima TaxID=34773 RepID=UPI001C0909D6|nr:uncharacterized protein LOC121693167 [Alosa sapidissima]XP_041928356.1 uncharacterized protein LOC121693167 [Alosa sapidissima]